MLPVQQSAGMIDDPMPDISVSHYRGWMKDKSAASGYIFLGLEINQKVHVKSLLLN